MSKCATKIREAMRPSCGARRDRKKPDVERNDLKMYIVV
jgi:hypothetical protein